MCPCQQGLYDTSSAVKNYVPIAVGAGSGIITYKSLQKKDTGVRVAGSIFASVAGYFLSSMAIAKFQP